MSQLQTKMAALDAVSQTCLKAVDKLRTLDYAGPQKQTFGDYLSGNFHDYNCYIFQQVLSNPHVSKPVFYRKRYLTHTVGRRVAVVHSLRDQITD